MRRLDTCCINSWDPDACRTCLNQGPIIRSLVQATVRKLKAEGPLSEMLKLGMQAEAGKAGHIDGQTLST